MKKILSLIISIDLAVTASAQFANTSWKGNFNIPDSTAMILQFKTDSLLLNYTDGSTLEAMSYKISNDTISIVKLYGQSPCSYTDTAIYKIWLKDKKLFISSLIDDCPDRVAAWPTGGLEKIE